MESQPRQRRLIRRYDAFEIKEIKNTATADRKAAAAHPDIAAACVELESLGFSDFAIAEGLNLLANEYRNRGQERLTQ